MVTSGGYPSRMTDGNVLVKGGLVVDGTGSAARRADVRVREGRIAEMAAELAPAPGEAVFDAAGCYVTPGFIDTHAHTDPQVFWDPTLDPDPLHGVTTMLVGNCSLSLYPASPETRGEIADLFAYIEDVPRYLFDENVPWTWSDYAGYRDAVNETGTGINIAALVGHSPIRLAVMGDDAWTRVATADERAAMAAILDDAMRAGAWGLSTSLLDVDKNGRPVPSRAADGAELDALLDVIQKHGRGFVEFVPGLLGPDPEIAVEDLARRCGKRGIVLTWTGFTHSDSNPAFTQRWLDMADRLHAEGILFYPQLSPRTVDFRLNWESSMMFMSMPDGWHRIVAAKGAEAKAALLRDPDWRAAAREEWDRVDKAMFPHRRPEYVRFVEVYGADNEPWRGRTLAELFAAHPEQHPSDVFADFVLANECRPGVVAVGISNADVDGVARTFKHPYVLMSSSDAGAHMQMLCASGDTTLILTRHVRERRDFTLEEAVYQLTGRQSEVFGFAGRGTIAPGNVADLVVFNLDELHYDDDEFVFDLPRGGSRLRRGEGGYRATFVSGVAVQLDGKMTGNLPGRAI